MKQCLALFLFLISMPAYAGQIVVEYNSPSVQQSDVLVESIGIGSIGGIFTKILQRGCELPCTSRQIFSTTVDDQEYVTVTLFRGNSTNISEAYRLGKYKVIGIPPARRGEPQIEIEFIASGSNIELKANDLNSDNSLYITKVE